MILTAYKILCHIKWMMNQFYNCLKIKLYRKNINIGANYKIKGTLCLTVGYESSIIIGENLKIYSDSYFNPISKGLESVICTEKSANIIIGDNVGMSSVCIWAHENIEIGNNVKIGAGTTIIDSDCHSLDYISRRGLEDQIYKKKSRICIGNDVLIGANCIILKGVTLGDRCIVGAGSVVVKSIPSDEIWAGNPAVFVKRNNSYYKSK